MIHGLPSPNSGPLFVFRDEPLRLYRVDLYGQFRAEGVEATAFEITMAPALLHARQPRSRTDRSKYSPQQCFAKGNR